MITKWAKLAAIDILMVHDQQAVFRGFGIVGIAFFAKKPHAIMVVAHTPLKRLSGLLTVVLPVGDTRHQRCP